MTLVFPIRLDREICIVDPFGVSNKLKIIENIYALGHYAFLDLQGSPTIVSGYDSSLENHGKGLRVTNLCFIEDGIIFKMCPACERHFPFETYSTRTTNERRDQSDCDECRRYKYLASSRKRN